jgi:Zn-dependent protease with chaperone function
MTGLLFIGIYLAWLLFILPTALTRASWVSRAPRAGVAVWLGIETTALFAALLILVGVLATPTSLGHLVIGVFKLCADGWQSLPHRLGAHLSDGVSALVLLATIVRLSVAAVTVVRQQHCRRDALRRALRVSGQKRADLGVTVVVHELAAAWSIPGRLDTVVITSTAMNQLSPAERSAVFAHERAHLKQNHARRLTFSAVLARAFPRLPLTVKAHAEIGRLLEMAADDAAVHEVGPQTVVGALVGLARTEPPKGALAANSLSAERAWRLLEHAPPLSLYRRRGILLLAVGMFILPTVAVAGPALFDGSPHCRVIGSAPKSIVVPLRPGERPVR